MQAVSGAGYPGVASLDILGNVVPHIPGEEEKLESETQKILGTLRDGGIDLAPFRVSAHCHRVPVENGHTEAVSVKLSAAGHARRRSLAAWREFTGEPQASPPALCARNTPSSIAKPPTARSRVSTSTPARGMSTVIGRLRPCNLFDWKFTLLSHNTIRGAAGAAILNAELLHAKGLLA